MLAWGLRPEPKQRRQRIDLSRIGRVLRRPSLSLLFGVIFSAFSRNSLIAWICTQPPYQPGYR